MPTQQTPLLIEKTAKTAVLLLMAYQLSWMAEGPVGQLLDLAGVALAGYYFENLGSRRRPGSNIKTRASRFISLAAQSDKLQLTNVYRNIINGGDAVWQKIQESFETPSDNRPGESQPTQTQIRRR